MLFFLYCDILTGSPKIEAIDAHYMLNMVNVQVLLHSRQNHCFVERVVQLPYRSGEIKYIKWCAD